LGRSFDIESPIEFKRLKDDDEKFATIVKTAFGN
jgi:hypothetical protein